MANVAVASADQAVAFARRQVSSGTSKWHNLCLSMVRQSFNLPAVEPSAKKAWENAKKKHKTTNTKNIPRGVPVFYKTSTKNWHVVLSAGDGMCYSTDVGGRGKVGYISIKALASSWNITLLGWTEDLNGFTVHKPAASAPEPAKLAKGLRALLRVRVTGLLQIPNRNLRDELRLRLRLGGLGGLERLHGPQASGERT